MTTATARTAVPFRASAGAASPPAAESPLARLRTLWKAHLREARCARARSLFSAIDLHTLRDIGAPECIIAEAAARGRARDRAFRDLDWS